MGYGRYHNLPPGVSNEMIEQQANGPDEEVGGPSCVKCGEPMGEDPQKCVKGGTCVWEEDDNE